MNSVIAEAVVLSECTEPDFIHNVTANFVMSKVTLTNISSCVTT